MTPVNDQDLCGYCGEYTQKNDGGSVGGASFEGKMHGETDGDIKVTEHAQDHVVSVRKTSVQYKMQDETDDKTKVTTVTAQKGWRFCWVCYISE